jgi:hypothetical protein
VKYAKAVSLIMAISMFGTLVWAFARGDFLKEGGQLVRMPWGIVSLVDVYVGFTLFSGWVVFREKSLAKSLPIVVAVMTLGNWVAALYTFLTLRQSGGDWNKFWTGKSADEVDAAR